MAPAIFFFSSVRRSWPGLVLGLVLWFGSLVLGLVLMINGDGDGLVSLFFKLLSQI